MLSVKRYDIADPIFQIAGKYQQLSDKLTIYFTDPLIRDADHIASQRVVTFMRKQKFGGP
jgi:hypothetical protein